MDTRTGEIVSWEKFEKIKKEKPLEARFYKEIPEELLDELKGMNRHERRKWYKLNKHRFNKLL